VPSGIRLRDRNGRLEPTVSLSKLLEESFQIAWEYLERTGELGDGAVASRFLSDTIEAMIGRGQRSRLALSNRAISAYQRFRSSGATGSGPTACSSALLHYTAGIPRAQTAEAANSKRPSASV
jgi:hypothetical protein